MDIPSWIGAVKNFSVEEFLEELYKGNKVGRLPVVSLYLNNGREIHGALVNIGKSEKTVCIIHSMNGVYDNPTQIEMYYVNLSQISYVTIKDVSKYMGLISENATRVITEKERISALALQRKLRAISENIKSTTGLEININPDWELFKNSEPSLVSLNEFTIELEKFIIESCKNDKGNIAKDCWSKISEFKFINENAKKEVKRNNSTILLTLNFSSHLPENLQNWLDENLSAIL